MNSRVMINRLRAAAAAFAVLAFLVYLNTVQLEDQSEDVLHSAGAASTSITRILAEREASSVRNAWTEYAALVSIGLGVTLAVAAPRLLNTRLR